MRGNPIFGSEPDRLKVGVEGLSGWVAAHGEPLAVPDVSQDARYVQMLGSSTRSELVIPIVVKDKVVGVLDVQSDRLNAFDSTDLAVMQSIANQTGAAIENARLYERAQELAVMQERNRLARDLHDAVTQTLFSASLLADALPASWEKDPEEGRQLLKELRQLSRGALAEMRTLLLELRPAALVETKLGILLRQLGEAAGGRTGLRITVNLAGDCILPAEAHIALYRIAQEALNNVLKHSRATNVTVGLSCRAGANNLIVELSVSDDGRGFDPAQVPSDHFGLRNMRERAQAIGAELTVVSQPGDGTRIQVVWENQEGAR
jgi:signal transduction histidine kinase